MANVKYKIEDLFIGQYATAKQIKFVNLKECAVVTNGKMYGIFLQTDKNKYMQISTGDILKSNVKPGLGQTWLINVKPLKNYVKNIDKELDIKNINEIERRLNEKAKAIKQAKDKNNNLEK